MTNLSDKFSVKEKTFLKKEQERKTNRPKGLSLCDDEESFFFGKASSLQLVLKKELANKARDCSCSDGDDSPWK